MVKKWPPMIEVILHQIFFQFSLSHCQIMLHGRFKMYAFYTLLNKNCLKHPVITIVMLRKNGTMPPPFIYIKWEQRFFLQNKCLRISKNDQNQKLINDLNFQLTLSENLNWIYFKFISTNISILTSPYITCQFTTT